MIVDKDWIERAKNIIGQDGVLFDASDMDAYSHDEFAMNTYVQIPKAVVKPSTEEQVAGIVSLCADTGCPGYCPGRRDRTLCGLCAWFRGDCAFPGTA